MEKLPAFSSTPSLALNLSSLSRWCMKLDFSAAALSGPPGKWARRCVQPANKWTLTFGLYPYTLRTISVQSPEVIFGL